MNDSNHAKNDDYIDMTILLEFLDEHALSVDLSMFILIWLVQIIIYPTFRKLKKEDFVSWHRGYCNSIGFFVLPIMSCQFLETVSACFFSSGNLVWVKLILVLGALFITFLISAPCHRILQQGKNNKIIDRLVRTNWWRTIFWTATLIVSTIIYYR